MQLGRDLVNDLIAVISGKHAQWVHFLCLPIMRFRRVRCRCGRGDGVRGCGQRAGEERAAEHSEQ